MSIVLIVETKMLKVVCHLFKFSISIILDTTSKITISLDQLEKCPPEGVVIEITSKVEIFFMVG